LRTLTAGLFHSVDGAVEARGYRSNADTDRDFAAVINSSPATPSPVRLCRLRWPARRRQ